MDLFHKIMELVDKNSDKIPEGDYLELCDTIHELRRRVKPPSFLLDQNQPLWMGHEPTLPVTDRLPSDPDTAAQRAREQLHQRWRELDEEVMYPGLNQFLQELHEEWSETDNIGPGMHQHVEDDTTVAEVSMMDVD
jgi:hypothetical protein